MKKLSVLMVMLLCVCLGLAPANAAYEPVIGDSTSMFYAWMDDMGHSYSTTNYSSGSDFCKVFQDRATYAGYGWGSAYTLTIEGTGSEYEGRLTSITYDAALDRTFKPGQTDRVLTDAYEAVMAAAEAQLSDSGSASFRNQYSRNRMWQVLSRALYEDFNPSQLSSRIDGWNFEVDVAYGDNEMHFYFYMTR